MASSIDSVHDGLNDEYSTPGGHVNWTHTEFPTPGQADENALDSCLPDLIRWAAEHKATQIGKGDCTVGHKTIKHWHFVGGGPLPRVRLPEPNMYIGFAGWKP